MLLTDTNPLPVLAVPYVGLKDAIGRFPKAAIISINGPEDGYTPFLPKANPILHLPISDIHCGQIWSDKSVKAVQQRGLILATDQDLHKVFAFAKTHHDKPIVVHCTAGVSRSPAIALLLTTQRFLGPRLDDALAQFVQHHPHILPNPYLLDLGSRLLGLSPSLRDRLAPPPSQDTQQPSTFSW